MYIISGENARNSDKTIFGPMLFGRNARSSAR